MNKLSNRNLNGEKISPFYIALKSRLETRHTALDALGDFKTKTSRRVLEEYGALFLASTKVHIPPTLIFTSQQQVLEFQQTATVASAEIEGTTIELQPAAMQALLDACKEAERAGLKITPRGGTEAARRSYEDTLWLWYTRVLPALEHWTSLDRITPECAEQLRNKKPIDQVEEIIELEEQGIFFSKDLKKSIFYSVAPPGTSQHLSMLAFDVTEFMDKGVRQILARYGWHQTVQSDLPHFTFLDLEEKDLPQYGLKKVEMNEQIFWIPDTCIQP